MLDNPNLSTFSDSEQKMTQIQRKLMAGTKFTPVRDQEFTFNYNYIYISYDSNPNVIDD